MVVETTFARDRIRPAGEDGFRYEVDKGALQPGCPQAVVIKHRHALALKRGGWDKLEDIAVKKLEGPACNREGVQIFYNHPEFTLRFGIYLTLRGLKRRKVARAY